MRRGFLTVFLIGMLMLSGCTKQPPAPSVRVVTRVEVSCRHEKSITERHYTAQEKMEPVLTYLRLLDRRGRAETDPEGISGNAYEIVLHFSDGDRTVYYQRAERFLSKNRHPWQRIDSAYAGSLYPILQAIPSDL